MSFGWFMLVFMNFFSSAMALQQQIPFARHFYHSSAVQADREYGSGDKCCQVPEPFAGLFQVWCPFLSSSTALEPPVVGTIRYGEALNPGPSPGDMLTVGVSNPGGLRQKEGILLEMGAGVWSLAETQLSATTFRTCKGILQTEGRKMNRELRFCGGAPAPLRQGSTWAGKWTGVAAISDVPMTSLDVPWPAEHWSSGRVMITRHWANSLPITIGTFYGFAQGPTWPKARQMSDQLLETYTTELVIGMSGVRLVMGDFNFEPGQLIQQQIWMKHG